MAGNVKLFMEKKEMYFMKSTVLFWPVIIALILLPFVDSLVFKTESHSYSEYYANQFFEVHEEFRLVGHVKETAASDELNCGLLCARNMKCQSYNCRSDGQHGHKMCELNDFKRHSTPKDLMSSKGFTYYERAKQGWYRDQPGHSCKHIRDSGDSRGDGEYWIDPESNGNPLLVYCDMTTDSGGWLLIYNIVIDGLSPPTTLGIETSYRGISNYSNNNMVLATIALNELRTHLSFTQLRFHCSRLQGRTFHVTTVANSPGEAVVQFFSRQTDAMPYACGSFARLDGDNSFIAGDCTRWGNDDGAFWVGKWGHEGMRELYKFPAFIAYDYHWTTNPEWPRWECDDYASSSVSPGDFWKIYVR